VEWVARPGGGRVNMFKMEVDKYLRANWGTKLSCKGTFCPRYEPLDGIT